MGDFPRQPVDSIADPGASEQGFFTHSEAGLDREAGYYKHGLKLDGSRAEVELGLKNDRDQCDNIAADRPQIAKRMFDRIVADAHGGPLLPNFGPRLESWRCYWDLATTRWKAVGRRGVLARHEGVATGGATE